MHNETKLLNIIKAVFDNVEQVTSNQANCVQHKVVNTTIEIVLINDHTVSFTWFDKQDADYSHVGVEINDVDKILLICQEIQQTAR